MRPSDLPAPSASWAWFFDVDGTLAAIAPSPGAARVEPAMRRAIASLHALTGGAVALITGRGISDVDRLFPGIRLATAGQHGLERRDARGRTRRHTPPSRGFENVREQLAAAAERHPGLLAEDKGLSLALHYRRVPALASYAHQLARRLAAGLGTGYAVQPGKRIVEIKPAGKDKGTAIREFMQERPFHGRTPVFLGDDTTDEYGFRAVNRLGGYAIKVGPGPTAARWRLADIGAVRAWLQSLPAPR